MKKDKQRITDKEIRQLVSACRNSNRLRTADALEQLRARTRELEAERDNYKTWRTSAVKSADKFYDKYNEEHAERVRVSKELTHLRDAVQKAERQLRDPNYNYPDRTEDARNTLTNALAEVVRLSAELRRADNCELVLCDEIEDLKSAARELFATDGSGGFYDAQQSRNARYRLHVLIGEADDKEITKGDNNG